METDLIDDKAAGVLNSYASNAWLADLLAGEVSHEESLIQLAFPTNCLNWVAGHIVNGRCTALALLDIDSIWDEALRARYKTGSPPVTDGSDARQFELIMADLAETQTLLVGGLNGATREQLEEVRETDRGEKPVEDHLTGLSWHETFHVGQIDMLVANIKAQRGEGV